MTKILDGHDVTLFRVVAVRHGKRYILLYQCESARADAGRKAFDQTLAAFKWLD